MIFFQEVSLSWWKPGCFLGKEEEVTILQRVRNISQRTPGLFTVGGGCSRSIVVAQSLSHVQLFVNPWTVALPGSSVHGIFQARILEWVAIPFSRGSSRSRDITHICIAGWFFTTVSPEKPSRSITNNQVSEVGRWRLGRQTCRVETQQRDGMKWSIL